MAHQTIRIEKFREKKSNNNNTIFAVYNIVHVGHNTPRRCGTPVGERWFARGTRLRVKQRVPGVVISSPGYVTHVNGGECTGRDDTFRS